MIIKGNTVGTTMPRTNYKQTDETKPDYLVGKDALDQKIAEAKKAGTDAAITAGHAKTKAESIEKKALMKTDGKMTEDINMDGHRITNLHEPTQDTDLITKKYMETYLGNYVDTTILGGEW